MAIRSCAMCKSIFQYVSGDPLCPKCKKKVEDDFDKVRKYLRKYPKSTMAQTAEDTGVSVRLITKFLRDGRLELTKDSPMKLNCERCGAKIQTGRYCDACIQEMQQQFRSTKDLKKQQKQTSDKQVSKLHYLNRSKVER